MGGQDLGLAARLERLGAGDLARHVASGSVPPHHAFDRLRADLEGAAVTARTTGEHALLASEVRGVLDRGGHLGDTFAALLSGDRSRMPTLAPVAADPASPPPPPTPPRPEPPVPTGAGGSAPFAVTVPALRAAQPAAATATGGLADDGFAWGAVALTAIGALLAFVLPVPVLLGVGPLVTVAVVGVLLADRVHLKDAGHVVPAWGWALLPPAYLFRRGRGLGRTPVHAYALVGLGMATRLGLVVFGFGGGDLADMASLEAELTSRYTEMWGHPATAECPPWTTLEQGAEFVCVVTNDVDAYRFDLSFRIVNDVGGVELTRSSLRSAPRPGDTTYNVAP